MATKQSGHSALSRLAVAYFSFIENKKTGDFYLNSQKNKEKYEMIRAKSVAFL